MVQETSQDAYMHVEARGIPEDQVRAMLAYLDEHGPATSQEVAAAGVVDEHSAGRRRSVLIRCGLATEDPPRSCAITGRRARPLRVTPRGRRVSLGGDIPAPAPSRRTREVAALAAARGVIEAWTRAGSVDDAALQGLRQALKALDERPAPRPEPWGATRRVEASRRGVWIRQDGSGVIIEDMSTHHLAGAIRFARRHDAYDSHPVLLPLLEEARRRGMEDLL